MVSLSPVLVSFLMLFIFPQSLWGSILMNEPRAIPLQSRSNELKPTLQIDFGHLREINTVTLSPDGSKVLTASADEKVILWDTATGATIKQFTGGPVIAFSPDGRHLVIGGRQTKLYNIASNSTPGNLYEAETDYAEAATFSPDGKFIALNHGENTIRIWDVASAKLIKIVEMGAFAKRLTYSPSGQYIAAGGSDSSVRLFQISTEKLIREFKLPSSRAQTISFSADSKLMLTSSSENVVTLWDVATGAMLKKISGKVATLSPDGKLIFVGDLTKGRIIDAVSEREMSAFENPGGIVQAAVFSTDQRYLLVGNSSGEAILRQANTGQIIKQFVAGYAAKTSYATVTPDGQRLLVAPRETAPRLFDLASAKPIGKFGGWIEKAVFTQDGKYMVTLGGGASLWDVESGKELQRLQVGVGTVRDATISADGQFVAAVSEGAVKIWKRESSAEVLSLQGGANEFVRFMPDGKHILIWNSRGGELWNISNWTKVRQFMAATQQEAIALEISPDGRYALTGTQGNNSQLWDLQSGSKWADLVPPADVDNGWVRCGAFSPDGRWVATAHDNSVLIWDIASRSVIKRLSGHSATIRSVVFAPDGKFIITASEDSTTRFWNTSGQEIGQLILLNGVYKITESAIANLVQARVDNSFIEIMKKFVGAEFLGINKITNLFRSRGVHYRLGPEFEKELAFRDDGWVMLSPENRFDTNQLEEIRGLHWIMPDDPIKPLPLEIFMRDYYEPRLLPRLLNGEKFTNKSIGQLNRVQPIIEIISNESQKDNPELVTVKVKVAKASGEYGIGNQKIKRETDVYDVRLFRDGQIVGQYPQDKTKVVASQVNLTDVQRLKAWQESVRVKPSEQIKQEADGSMTITFKDVKLPRTNLEKIEFSAYAFNEDRVKSQTSRKIYDLPKGLAAQKGKTYLVTVGVNSYQNKAWDLRYAANDARDAQRLLVEKLKQTGEYADVVGVSLVSDTAKQAGEKDATKANFKATLEEIARNARPEDTVIIYYSSHGYGDKRGNFYLFPTDIGAGSGKEITPQLLDHCISSEELSEWLRGVDAGEMVMVIDACQSAGTVKGEEGGEFKPGPMGSRGLGQLAYDKGMKILAASQADDYAFEYDRLQHGLLSYALLSDGVEAKKADQKPKDRLIMMSEWLGYGERRVPVLVEAMRRGELASLLKTEGSKGVKEVTEVGGANSLKKKGAFQQPSLFDFTRKKKDVVLSKLVN
jgi:WD40 repeat protein